MLNNPRDFIATSEKQHLFLSYKYNKDGKCFVIAIVPNTIKNLTLIMYFLFLYSPENNWIHNQQLDESLLTEVNKISNKFQRSFIHREGNQLKYLLVTRGAESSLVGGTKKNCSSTLAYVTNRSHYGIPMATFL